MLRRYFLDYTKCWFHEILVGFAPKIIISPWCQQADISGRMNTAITRNSLETKPVQTHGRGNGKLKNNI